MASHGFETLDSELIYSAPILALRRDQVHMPTGNTASREVVEHFGAVAIAAVNKNGQVALIYQYRASVARKLWELPAGLLDISGEDALVCAQRELQEEAGLKAENWSVLADLVTSPGFSDEAVRIFLATELSEVERPQAEDEEADLLLKWVDLDEAKRKVLNGEINNSIAVAGIFAASEVTVAGAQSRPADAEFSLRPQALAARRAHGGTGVDMKKLS